MAATTLEDVIAFITHTADTRDLSLLSGALEARCAEEGARCALTATAGTYITLWNCDPSYLDGLRGTITRVDENGDATVLLDSASATVLRFNLDAQEEGYVTTYGAHESLQVTVNAACCRVSDLEDDIASSSIIASFVDQLATM